MAAKKIYYKKRFFKRSSGRWSSNIKTITNQQLDAPVGSFYGSIDLCTNPIQLDSTVSQKYTVKNIEFAFTSDNRFSSNEALIDALTGYIMYVPEGYAVTETLPSLHPEWIMAYKFYGKGGISDISSQYVRPLSIKTRLSRRLNTGDKVILLLTGNNSATQGNQTLQINGIVRWWTKAN